MANEEDMSLRPQWVGEEMPEAMREILAAYKVAFAWRGGKARMERLTPERRREIARMGAVAKNAKARGKND